MAPEKKNNTGSLKKKDDASTSNALPTARNLTKKQLGAIIFGCKHHTFSECVKKQIFGLPAGHFSYVKNVSPGLTLFLFNYSDRKLHGIFRAVSVGQMNMDRYAWTTCEGAETTPYAAQVRVESQMECRPLLEEEFKPLIAKNYYSDNLFWFELDKGQAKRLIKLFTSSPFPAKVPRAMPHPPKAAQRQNMFKALSSSDENVAADEEAENEDWQDYSGTTDMKLEVNESSCEPVRVDGDVVPVERKWSELFKPSSSSRTVNNTQDGEARSNLSVPGYFDSQWNVASSSYAMSKLPSGACPGVANGECDSGVVECWEDSLVDNESGEIYENEQIHELLESDTEDKVGYGTVSAPSENCESEHIQSDLTDRAAFLENGNASSEGVLTDIQSLNFESAIIKLTREVEGLKFSQLKQSLKVGSLEQELVQSKLEIDQLKNRCRDLESMPSSVLIVGGFDGDSWLPDLSLYYPLLDNVVPLPPMTFPRSYASVAKSNGEVYIFGGVNDGLWYDTVESYNPRINQWIKRPSLNKKKGSLAGASLYDTIFAIGGGSGVECFSEVEVLDHDIGSWISTQSMLEKRYATSAAGINGALYVAGGYDGREYLRSVERFDPREHAWTRVANMNSKRGCHSLVAFKEKLYALGGYDGNTTVSTVEVFDPRCGSWTMDEPMTVARGHFASFILGEKIYAIGGMGTDGEVLDVIERYEEDSGWQALGQTAVGKRSFFSAVVL